jgi:hypothetical protein
VGPKAHEKSDNTAPFGVSLLQGAYNKLNDQSCKRVLHAVVHNRALKEVRLVEMGVAKHHLARSLRTTPVSGCMCCACWPV